MKKSLLFLSCIICLMAVSPLASAQKKAKKEVRPVYEVLQDLRKTVRATGNIDFDNFIAGAVNMAASFQKMSDEYGNIKIETVDIPDEGDGVTTAVKITDGQGNTRTKESVLESNAKTALNATRMTVDATIMVASGASLIADIVNDPVQAISLAFGIKQMKLAIEALKAMSVEVPIFKEKVKAQTEALKQAKSI